MCIRDSLTTLDKVVRADSTRVTVVRIGEPIQTDGALMAALRRAYVTDFFDVKIWPVWNVADMCVVSGVAILAWMLWRVENTEADGHPVTDGG